MQLEMNSCKSDDYFGSWRRVVRHSLFFEDFINIY